MLHSILLLKRVAISILFIGIVFLAQAQILDDTTKRLYGYHSVRYGTEADVFYNRGLTTEVDSSLASIQRYGYIYRNKQFSQDLGNWVTPIQSVTSVGPSQTGVQTGFNVYSPYEFNANALKYFDTRAPYAELKYYQGSRGQQSMDASFTRNMNPQWNFGLDFRRIVSKQIIGYTSRNNKQAENYVFDVFLSHHSKNDRYFMLASFNYIEAHNFENGGIRPDSIIDTQSGILRAPTKDDLFGNQLTSVWLTSTRSLDKRYNYRLYQHYDILKDHKLQVFYRFDYSRRTNRYNDNSLATNAPYYALYSDFTPKGRYDTVSVADRTDFNLFDNRAGVKGETGKFFYAAYIKNRYVTMRQNAYSDSTAPYNRYTSEWYLDGLLRRYFDEDKKSYVEASVDLGVINHTNTITRDSTKNNYNYSAAFIHKGFRIEGSIWGVSPSMVQNHYTSNLVRWDNKFELQKTNKLLAEYGFKTKRFDVIPSIGFSQYDNFIYYTAAGTPAQFTTEIRHVQPKLGLRFNLWKVHVYNEFQYNHISNGSKILQMPGVVNATQFFIEAWLFKRATLLQTGFDVMYRSSFQSNGYNAAIQQFYVTEYTGKSASDFNYINQYTVVDFFVNMQIRTARLFFKVSNIKGIITPKEGYFMTPYYTGLPYTLDFGVSWRFFD